MPLIPFVTDANPRKDYAGARLKNYFLRPYEGWVALIGRSGIGERHDVTEPVQAILDRSGDLFFCSGGYVYKVSGGVLTNVGTVVDDPQTVMAASASQVAIVAGGNYYICNGTTTTQYTAGAITSAVSVAHLDGFFIVAGTGAGRNDCIQVSALDDGT